MRRRSSLLAWTLLAFTVPAQPQSQSTFYAAFEDGQELERRGEWRQALSAYQRAVALRPTSADRVVIYGNNLLRNYHPYTRMARCHLELKELEATEALLLRARAQQEPAREVEALDRRVRELRAERQPKVSVPPEPAPNSEEALPVHPADPPKPAAESHPEPSPEAVRPNEPDSPRPAPAPMPSAPTRVGPRPLPEAAASSSSVVPSPGTSTHAVPPAERSRAWWALLLLPCLALLWRRRRVSQEEHALGDPDRVGPYRVERLLGRGGFASTYLAHHEASGRRVALKRLHPHRQDDAEFLGRFHQEATLGSRLHHPNLVQLVDPGPPEGHWLAMAYEEGERLDARLKAGPMPLPEVLALARGIARGLAYAHGEGVVHRDLKPANVILAADAVKVMDFGIARVMDAETLTTTYAFLGTPKYAAPEAQMKTAIGPAADWYSFGIMLFEMLAGRPPFSGETPFEILDRHRAEPLPDLRALRPEAPEPLIELIEVLCAKAPEARPGDAEVLRRLDAIPL